MVLDSALPTQQWEFPSYRKELIHSAMSKMTDPRLKLMGE